MLLTQLGISYEITLSSFIKGFGLTKSRADVADLNCIQMGKKKKKEKTLDKTKQDMWKET